MTPAQCKSITSICRSWPAAEATVVDELGLPQHRVGDVRFIPNTEDAQPIYELIWEFADAAARSRFDMDVTSITRCPQYVEYSAGNGHFHWHDDYSHERRIAPRKLTVIMQLSDDLDYKGGSLEIFGIGPITLPRAQGEMICFPSFVPHRVTPVTEGIRKVVVAWIAGPRVR